MVARKKKGSQPVARLWQVSAGKVRRLLGRYDPAAGSPVFTKDGKYTAQGWTEWTQGFQFGSAILQFDATGDEAFLELGRTRTVERMAPHVTHVGVHDQLAGLDLPVGGVVQQGEVAQVMA